MSISWIKSKNDNKSFIFFKNMGLDVNEIEDLDKTDEVIRDLIRKKKRYNCVNK